MHQTHSRSALGIFGELFTQLRLWQYGVDTATYLLDSGTDLVGASVNAEHPIGIQVKTAAAFPDIYKVDGKRCPLLAWVLVPGDEGDLHRYFGRESLGDIKLFLIPYDRIADARDDHGKYELRPDNLQVLREYFGEPTKPS